MEGFSADQIDVGRIFGEPDSADLNAFRLFFRRLRNHNVDFLVSPYSNFLL